MKRNRIIAAGLAVLALGGAAAGAAAAAGGDSATPITGAALAKAEAAALETAPGATVTGTEVGDEESYYQVEVTKSDGAIEDVQLNRAFEVVGRAVDREGR